MIILKPGDNLLGIITGSVDYYISYVDLKGFESGNTMDSLTTTLGETILLYSPNEGVRQVKYMSFRTASSGTLSLLFRTNTGQGIVKKIFYQCDVEAGDIVEYTSDEGFRVKNSIGSVKTDTNNNTNTFGAKVLGQSNPLATTLTTLYTTPADKNTYCTSIVVANRSAVATTFRVAVRPSGAAISNEHYLYYDIPINGNDTFTATIGITLSQTDIVSVYATLATLSFNLFGQEI